MKAWLLLALAVVSEVIADSSLKASQGFTRLAPSILAVVGYLSALFLFSTSLKTLPLSLAYSVWAGLGITGAVLVGVIYWREHLTPLHIVAIALILSCCFAQLRITKCPISICGFVFKFHFFRGQYEYKHKQTGYR